MLIETAAIAFAHCLMIVKVAIYKNLNSFFNKKETDAFFLGRIRPSIATPNTTAQPTAKGQRRRQLLQKQVVYKHEKALTALV